MPSIFAFLTAEELPPPSEPSRSLMPLKLVDSEIRSISQLAGFQGAGKAVLRLPHQPRGRRRFRSPAPSPVRQTEGASRRMPRFGLKAREVPRRRALAPRKFGLESKLPLPHCPSTPQFFEKNRVKLFRPLPSGPGAAFFPKLKFYSTLLL